MFDSATEAELYDLVYQSRKDYEAEAARTTELIKTRNPGAATLLDVACGTGIHLATFVKHFEHVAGVDLAEPMLARATQRLPGVPLRRGDMRDFDLGRVFDAVVCMFSAIAYVDTVDDMRAAVRTMTRHLADDGVLIVEPWYFPENFIPGYVSAHAVRDGDRGAAARVAHSTREGDKTRIQIHYLLADGDTGVRHVTGVDHLTLFSREDYLNAFGENGLNAEYLPADDSGPGFFVGVRT
jgi:SAM-dependent methyltransferase